MVAEVRPDYPSDWPAIVAVAQRLGIGVRGRLRAEVRELRPQRADRPV
jgi:transposase